MYQIVTHRPLEAGGLSKGWAHSLKSKPLELDLPKTLIKLSPYLVLS
jgi:hypothetical protein